MENSLTIQIPEGFEIDKEKSTFEKIIFKKKVLDWPKDWEGLKIVKGFYTSANSEILANTGVSTGTSKNTIPTESLAKAMLALCQLLQLRNYVWKNFCNDWKPDLIGEYKFCILTSYSKDTLVTFTYNTNKILIFPKQTIAEKFLNQYKDLIEEAKELL